jgi:prepilin-type N-terminal cleavage/methylation domain-containing protein
MPGNSYFVGQTFLSAKKRQTRMSAPRAALTLVEVTITLAIIGILVVIVTQCMVMSLRERGRMASQQAAQELAANTLEAARAQPWEKLDKTWADTQTLPAEMADLLPEGKIVVTVEPGQPESQTRRVTVEVRWQVEPDQEPRSVRLTTVLSARTAKKAGGNP